MGWGKGGMVGVGAAIHLHQKAQDMAAMILEAEHGKKHQPGERRVDWHPAGAVSGTGRPVTGRTSGSQAASQAGEALGRLEGNSAFAGGMDAERNEVERPANAEVTGA